MGSSPPVFQVVDNPTSFEKSLIMRVSTEDLHIFLNKIILLDEFSVNISSVYLFLVQKLTLRIDYSAVMKI